MDECGKCRVPHQHIAGLQFRMQLSHLCQVVRSQRRGQHLHEQSASRIEHGQEMRDRKAAAGALHPRLAEVLAQRFGIGHRAAAAVRAEGAMSAP